MAMVMVCDARRPRFGRLLAERRMSRADVRNANICFDTPKGVGVWGWCGRLYVQVGPMRAGAGKSGVTNGKLIATL